MDRRNMIFGLTGLSLGLLLLAGVALADTDGRPGVVVRDGDDEVYVNLSDNVLTVRVADEYDDELIEVDLEGIGAIINSTLSECLAVLNDSQLDLHMGRDNRLQIALDDTEFELDINEILHQTSVAVQTACAEFDTDDWTDTRPRYSDESLDADLQDEIRKLQQEIRSLRRDLKRIQSQKTN